MSTNAPTKPLAIKDYKSDLHNDWCPGCLAPETLIVTPAGKTPIRDIVVGDTVLGHDSRWHRVTDVMSHWHPSSMRRVVVEHLGAVVLTADHPMYVSRDGHRGLEATWVPAGEVQVGDDVAYALPVQDATRESVAAPIAARGGVATLDEPACDTTQAMSYRIARVVANEEIPYNGFVHNIEEKGVHSYVTDAETLHNCGDFGILTGIQMALQQMQIEPDKLAVYSGIGCSGKTPHYINGYGFHTLH